MKFTPLLILLSLVLSPVVGEAAEKKDIKTQLQELVVELRTKLEAGKTNEQQLGAEIKKFDQLVATHKGDRGQSDALAEIVFVKAMLYFQVFENVEKSKAILKELRTNFPESNYAKTMDQLLGNMDREVAVKKMRNQLVVGAKFPDFKEIDLEGEPLSISRFNGKVVLVDFWATWCGPCIRELPNVLAAYNKFHDKGFEIVGISLDVDKEALTRFTKSKQMPWPQYFDGKRWENKLAGQYGIGSIPATFLLDRQGKIVAKDLSGTQLAEEVGKLVAKK